MFVKVNLVTEKNFYSFKVAERRQTRFSSKDWGRRVAESTPASNWILEDTRMSYSMIHQLHTERRGKVHAFFDLPRPLDITFLSVTALMLH